MTPDAMRVLVDEDGMVAIGPLTAWPHAPSPLPDPSPDPAPDPPDPAGLPPLVPPPPIVRGRPIGRCIECGDEATHVYQTIYGEHGARMELRCKRHRVSPLWNYTQGPNRRVRGLHGRS